MDKSQKKLNNIQPFFEKFKHIVPREVIIKENFIEVFKDVFDIQIHKDHIDVRGKNIFLTISPVMKQEILYKKENLLERLNKIIGDNIIQDIR